MARELEEFNWLDLGPAQPSRNDSVKIETSFYLGKGKERVSLTLWFREVDIVIASSFFEVP